MVRHIRRRCPDTHITFRGDGHYACPEAMTWCEQNGIDYVLGLAGIKPLARKVDEASSAGSAPEGWPSAPWCRAPVHLRIAFARSQGN
jgi:hypothetical protein